MKKFLLLVDDIIRLPLTLINYLAFQYFEISEYARDRINLLACAVVFSTFSYWSPLLFSKSIVTIQTIYEYLLLQIPENSNGGLIYEYQTLFAGILALIAGAFAIFAVALSHVFERMKVKREFVMRMRGWAIKTNIEVNAILNSEDPLNHFNLKTLPNINSLFFTKRVLLVPSR